MLEKLKGIIPSLIKNLIGKAQVGENVGTINLGGTHNYHYYIAPGVDPEKIKQTFTKEKTEYIIHQTTETVHKNEGAISSLPEESQFQFLVSTASTLASASALDIGNLDDAPLVMGEIDGETSSMTTVRSSTQQNVNDDSYWKTHEE